MSAGRLACLAPLASYAALFAGLAGRLAPMRRAPVPGLLALLVLVCGRGAGVQHRACGGASRA